MKLRIAQIALSVACLNQFPASAGADDTIHFEIDVKNQTNIAVYVIANEGDGDPIAVDAGDTQPVKWSLPRCQGDSPELFLGTDPEIKNRIAVVKYDVKYGDDCKLEYKRTQMDEDGYQVSDKSESKYTRQLTLESQ